MKNILVVFFTAVCAVCITGCTHKCIYIRNHDMNKHICSNVCVDDSDGDSIDICDDSCKIVSIDSCKAVCIDSRTYNDGMVIKTMKVENIDKKYKHKFSFTVDFPVKGNDKLTKAIKKEIFCAMGDEDTNDFSVEKMQRMADEYIIDCSGSIDNESIEAGIMSPYSNEGTIKLIDNTEKYITYFFDLFMYTGGAHGFAAKGYFSIDKSTCRLIKLDDLTAPGKKDRLKEIIRSNIKNQYYKGKVSSWNDNFDLPGMDPGFTKKGLGIYYGCYEIDNHAAGMPNCIIPYDELKDVLSDKAKRLIR